MGDWESIFKRKGKVFLKLQEDITGVVKFLKENKTERVLDLGCGTGRHVVYMAKNGFEVFGTDVSETGLEITRKELKRFGLKAKLKKASCYKKFPFKDGFFDAVISTQVFFHNFPNKVKFCVKEIERVLRPGGVVFVTVKGRKKVFGSTKYKKIGRVVIPLDGDEKGVPHFVYNKKLLREDFRNFKIINIHKDSGQHYCLLGIKN